MIGILLLTIIAFIISFIIVLVDNKLNLEPSLKKDIEAALPGYNCGACGFGSCHGMALKIVENIDNYHACRMLKDKEELFKVLERYGEKVDEDNKKSID